MNRIDFFAAAALSGLIGKYDLTDAVGTACEIAWRYAKIMEELSPEIDLETSFDNTEEDCNKEEEDYRIPSESMAPRSVSLDSKMYAVFNDEGDLLAETVSNSIEESEAAAEEVSEYLWEALKKFGFSVKEISLYPLDISV